MVAFAHVYEIFTVTQLQFAVTSKKFTEQACGRFCFQKFYTSYIKYSCMLVNVYWRKCIFKNLSPLLRTDRTPMNKIQVQYNEAKLHV